jgi:hypothetical protein
LGLVHCRLSEPHGNLIVRRVDCEQQVAFMHELIVSHGQLDDAVGDLRSHGDDIGAHGAVARPRRPMYVFHIAQPSPAASAVMASVINSETILIRARCHTARSRLEGANDTKISHGAGFGFRIGHGELSVT